MAKRLRQDFTQITLKPERLDQPIRWRRPRRIFVNSLSDLFHPAVPVGFVDSVFATMLAASRHTFQLLTKRPRAMLDYLKAGRLPVVPNLWLGVSVEDQKRADERIPILLECPAAVRWVSVEPMLGPVDLAPYLEEGEPFAPAQPRVDWVVVGGESGPKARPMDPEWARNLRDQCLEAGVSFLFKQWGEWMPGDQRDLTQAEYDRAGMSYVDSKYPGAGLVVYKVGKKAAGRLLDGQLWDQYPGAGLGKDGDR